MNILQTLQQLRDDIKTWVTNNLNALNAKIDEKTIPIDNELSTTSTNPVQNKAITNAINSIPTFSGDYNDLTNAPNISEDSSGNMIISDESGNVIFKADADGIHTTAVSLNGETAASERYVDDAVAAIDIPETDLSDYYTKEQTDTAIDTAKEELSESIVAESDEWKVVDEAGNIIFSVDADGAHTTSLSLNGEPVTDIIDERVASLVDSAPDTLNTLNELAAALGDDPNFATTVATEIGKKVDKENGKGLSTNDFTNDYKNTLDNLSSMTFDESDPTVPAWAKADTKPAYTAEEVGALDESTALADLPDDADHRTVTDAEKASWSAKSDFSGSYNDLTDAPNIVEDDTDNMVIADGEGNIVFRSDANGLETPQLIANSVVVNGIDVEEALHNNTFPTDAVAGDLLCYDGTNWVRISKADLIAEIIAALPRAEEASF